MKVKRRASRIATQRDWAVQAALERLTCLSSVLVRPVKVPIMRQPGKPEYHVMTQIEAQSNSEGPAAQSRDNSPQLLEQNSTLGQRLFCGEIFA
jgi:hypothetical protein